MCVGIVRCVLPKQAGEHFPPLFTAAFVCTLYLYVCMNICIICARVMCMSVCLSVALCESQWRALSVWVRPYLVCSDTSRSATAAQAAALITISTQPLHLMSRSNSWSQQQPTPTLANALQSPSVSLLAFCALCSALRAAAAECCVMLSPSSEHSTRDTRVCVCAYSLQRGECYNVEACSKEHIVAL